jgi:hypothetical protein
VRGAAGGARDDLPAAVPGYMVRDATFGTGGSGSDDDDDVVAESTTLV